MKKIKQNFLILAAGLGAMFALGGCAAAQKTGEFFEQRAVKGYTQTQAAAARIDEAKRRVAADDLAQAKRRAEFAAKFGADVDAAGLNWLDGHLRRVANFVCDLNARGVVVRDIATRDPNTAARIVCLAKAAQAGDRDAPPATAAAKK